MHYNKYLINVKYHYKNFLSTEMTCSETKEKTYKHIHSANFKRGRLEQASMLFGIKMTKKLDIFKENIYLYVPILLFMHLFHFF